MNNITIEKVLEALQIGLESTQSESDDYHAKMAGYRQYRHDAMDEDVNKIKDAIKILEYYINKEEIE